MAKLVLTKHARERMELRNIPESLVIKTIEDHDFIKPEDDGDIQFIREVARNGYYRKMYVIAKRLEDKEVEVDKWLIKTVWIRGEDDPKKPNPFFQAIRAFFARLFGGKKSRK